MSRQTREALLLDLIIGELATRQRAGSVCGGAYRGFLYPVLEEEALRLSRGLLASAVAKQPE